MAESILISLMGETIAEWRAREREKKTVILGSHSPRTINPVSGIEESFRKSGVITNVILFVLCQIRFVSSVSNREQAFQTNRIERTISILSVRKNN
jgi:hypothetical protein